MKRLFRNEGATSTISVTELLVWVGGVGGLAGLVGESLRQSRNESGVVPVCVGLLIYLVYLAFSVRMFWNAPRLVIPIILLLGGVLWTLAIQGLDGKNIPLQVMGVLIVPFFLAFLIRLIFPGMASEEDQPEEAEPATTVRSLLLRHKGLGRRSGLERARARPGR